MLKYNTLPNSSIDTKLNLIQQKIHDLLLSANIKKQSSFLFKSYIFKPFFKPNFLKSRVLLTLLAINQEHDYNYDLDYDFDNIISYCVIIELIHIATKIHDFIQYDQTNSKIILLENDLKLTVAQAILLGDLVLTLAFDHVTVMNNPGVLDHFATVAKNWALFETELSEFIPTTPPQHQNIILTNIIALVEKKHWSLYTSIIYFLSSIPIVIKLKLELELYIKNINKINILSKIIKNKIIFNKDIINYIFENNENKFTSYFKHQLDTSIIDTQNTDFFSKNYSRSIIIQLQQLVITSTN